MRLIWTSKGERVQDRCSPDSLDQPRYLDRTPQNNTNTRHTIGRLSDIPGIEDSELYCPLFPEEVLRVS